MKSSISLIGVGLPGTYQLVSLVPNIAPFTLFGGMYPTFGLFLLDQVTGALIPAENMPVTIRPGFLKQGEHAASGDTDVLHCAVTGSMIPKEVSTALAASLPILANTRNTGFKVYNSVSLTKTNLYNAFLSSYVAITSYPYHFYMPSVYRDDRGTTGSITIENIDGKYILTVIYDNSSYNHKFISTVTGNLYKYPKSGTTGSHCLTGTWASYLLTKQTGVVSKSGGTTSSGISLHVWTKPTSLAGISTELVLSSIGNMGDSGALSDLMSLISLDRGNAPWQACSYAVESMKNISFEGMEFVRDSSQVQMLLPPLSAFTKLAKPSSWAQIFLWIHYGLIPMAGSALELIKHLNATGFQSIMSIAEQFAKSQTRYGTVYDNTQTVRDTKVMYKCNAKVSVHPIVQPQNTVDALFLVCKSYNLVGSAANIWELLPYSFVVDWFVNENQFCSFIDYVCYPTNYHVNQIILSHKWSFDMPASTYYPGATGSVTLGAYAREIHYKFPMEPFALRFRDPDSHWLEGIALLIART